MEPRLKYICGISPRGGGKSMSGSGTTNNDSLSANREGLAHRFLRLFTVVRPGEAPTAILMALNVFIVLMTYYMLKPLREALFMGSFSPAQKRYVAVAQALLLILVVKGFCWIASRVARHKLITWVTLFFISNLALFYVLQASGLFVDLFGPESAPKILGLSFFVWVGVFNVTVIAQFWAFANDIYTQEAGKRLFPLVAFGATFGGFVGAWPRREFSGFLFF
jgi:AAA family ATP:ADP antiporter